MATMDVFNQDAFTTFELTTALEMVDYTPSLLGSLNLFTPRPVRTETVAVEKRENVLAIIPTSERGTPLGQHTPSKRDIRDFRTVRLAKQDTIQASEIQNIRAFGSTGELQAVANEVMRRFTGPGGLVNQLEATWEFHRLGAVQGVVLDADGSVIRNWYDEWGITQADEVDFELDDADTVIRTKCQAVRRAMRKAAKGAWTPATSVHALCGDAFYDALIDHANVRSTYQNWAAAAELRQNIEYEAFPYGGIVFHNYQGTDDFDDGGTEGTEMFGIPSAKAKFFPVGAPGVFEAAWSPGESFDFANTPGMPMYGMIVRDLQRNQWAQPEVYSYPLFMCTRPAMLQRAKLA